MQLTFLSFVSKGFVYVIYLYFYATPCACIFANSDHKVGTSILLVAFYTA